MFNRRKTDHKPTEREPWIGVFLIEWLCIALLVAALILAVSASSAHAGITGHITEHDPLKGTITYQQALDRITYAGSLPAQWALHISGGQVTGTLDRLHYYGVSQDKYRADVEFQTYVAGRIFASGFEK